MSHEPCRALPLSLGVCLALFAGACQDATIPEQSPWTEQVLASDAEFRDIFFLDEKRGWIVGGGHAVDGGILGSTIDGGAHWSFRSGIVAKVKTRLFHLNAVHFENPSIGLITADEGRVMRSVDGGAHWHTLLRAGRSNLSDLFFIDDLRGWAAGEQWIMRTVDGGRTWTRRNAPPQGDDDFRAVAIHFLDADEGWLVGHHAALRRTRDGGVTWAAIDLGFEDERPVLRGIQFVGRERGWVVGNDGTILSTVDAGESWARQQTGSLAHFNDVHFIDELRGWIVGFDPSIGLSTIFHTIDGGETWIQQATILGESLQALWFQPDGRGWAVGDRVRREPQRLLRYEPPADPRPAESTP